MKRTVLERVGLSAKWSKDLHARGAKRGDPSLPAGWYVFAESSEGPHAVLALRFLRERDALLAIHGLEQAGLTNVRKMKEAGPEKVIQTAFEALQW